jgi:hypothetical protein
MSGLSTVGPIIESGASRIRSRVWCTLGCCCVFNMLFLPLLRQWGRWPILGLWIFIRRRARFLYVHMLHVLAEFYLKGYRIDVRESGSEAKCSGWIFQRGPQTYKVNIFACLVTDTVSLLHYLPPQWFRICPPYLKSAIRIFNKTTTVERWASDLSTHIF